MSRSAPARVLALALSEASWSCLRDPAFVDRLPFLGRLHERGARGITLASQPLVGHSLWATVVTGRTPGGHGIFGASRLSEDGSPRAVSARDLAAPPIWRLLEDAGIPAATFTAPLTGPTEAVSGFMVWRDARPVVHAELVHPPGLYAPLHARFGAWTTVTTARTKAAWTSLVPRELETRTEVLAELLRTRPWTFALAHFAEVGRVQHRFWKDGQETLRSLYATMDRAIARLAEAAGPGTIVFVFSECGGGPIRHGVDLNEWLEAEGFLVRRRGALPRLGRSVARIHKRARRLLPRALDLSALKMRVRAAIDASNVDWSRTRAFAPADTSTIAFNVPAGERPALAAELGARLLALRDPEGRRAVEDVIPREAWSAPGDAAPDLTVVWDDDAYMPADTFGARRGVFVDWCPEFADWTFTGSHRRQGMLLVSGPGVDHVDLGRVRTVDLVPTWLDLLGVDVPKDVEGTSFAPRLFRPS